MSLVLEIHRFRSNASLLKSSLTEHVYWRLQKQGLQQSNQKIDGVNR
jgi:hypothetical protein